VAIYYQDVTGFELITQVTTFGGAGVSAPNGGAGTVFLQGPGREEGELVVDNSSIVAETTPILPDPASILALTNLRVRRAAKVVIDDHVILTGTLEVSTGGEVALKNQVTSTNIDLVDGGVLGQLPSNATESFKLILNADTIIVDATSRIDATGLGFLGGAQPGNPFGDNGMTIGFQQGSTGRSGGSYGGLGGAIGGTSNPAYGDFRDPNDPGSGGGTNLRVGGNGGGVIRIVVQTLNLNGVIKADGETSGSSREAAGGSGGSIRIDVGTLQGSGQIRANGGNGLLASGGGGGGRVAIYYQDVTGFELITQVTTFGGAGVSAPNGGAGTVFLQGPVRETGEIIVDNNNVVTATQSTPILPSPSGLLTLTKLSVRRAARVRLADQVILTGTLEVSSGGEFIPVNPVIASTINVNNSSTINQLPTTATAFFKVDLTTGTLTIDATSRIGATGQGFLGGAQPGNPFGDNGMTVGFQQGSTGRSGGSYGGLGGAIGGTSNPAYGDFRDPSDPGSGGGTNLRVGGNGGGLIRIVAQTLNLNGVIKADGETSGSSREAAGGSGGGIRIDVGTLQGSGQITANGGNGLLASGGGGGGRVAIYYQDATGFDLATQVTVSGGSGNAAPNGADGTVLLEQIIAMLLPSDGEFPIIRKAEAQFEMPVRLASLNPVPITSNKLPNHSKPEIPHRLLYLKKLIADVQSKMRDNSLPQRRVFSYQSKIQNPKSKINGNRNLALAAAKTDDADMDPIYVYDLNGNRISMIDPTGLTTYNYDELNRLTSITNNEGLTTTFTYDALGRRTSMTHDNGVVTTYDYDAASQLLSLVHQLGATTINSFTYTYDKVGNRKTKADNNGTANYTYDTLNRLVQATNPLPTNPLESLTYDEVGNRVDSNQNGLSTINVANQLEEDASFNYLYDANGNLVQKTDKSTLLSTVYEYDAENKLVRVASLDKTVNYNYDGLGRRIEKEVTETAVTTVRQYIYDNEDILLELDDSNNIIGRYTHGPGIDEPLIVEKNGVSSFYHADSLGSITQLTDSVGIVVQSFTYSSFGRIESQLDPNFLQPYTFTSRELDPETGLYFYRARTYDPLVGRFLQEDPLKGTIEIPQTIHPYVYALNDPISLKDPNGEAVPLVAVIVGVGAVLGGTGEALAVIRRGGSGGETLRAFGQGAFAGGVASATGILVALGTANPFLVGASAGLAFGLTNQLIQSSGRLECLDAISLAFGTATGAALGPLNRIPGLKLRGRHPDLWRPRSLSEFGPNSRRLIEQQALGGGLGLAIDHVHNQNF